MTTSRRLCSPRMGFPISAILRASSSSELICPSAPSVVWEGGNKESSPDLAVPDSLRYGRMTVPRAPELRTTVTSMVPTLSLTRTMRSLNVKMPAWSSSRMVTVATRGSIRRPLGAAPTSSLSNIPSASPTRRFYISAKGNRLSPELLGTTTASVSVPQFSMHWLWALSKEMRLQSPRSSSSGASSSVTAVRRALSAACLFRTLPAPIIMRVALMETDGGREEGRRELSDVVGHAARRAVLSPDSAVLGRHHGAPARRELAVYDHLHAALVGCQVSLRLHDDAVALVGAVAFAHVLVEEQAAVSDPGQEYTHREVQQAYVTAWIPFMFASPKERDSSKVESTMTDMSRVHLRRHKPNMWILEALEVMGCRTASVIIYFSELKINTAIISQSFCEHIKYADESWISRHHFDSSELEGSQLPAPFS
ncbi:hypothetical protein EYF80_012979 [Liparis tanakae]|uniref:Uncharacterized protein n=1 Tax=Liparis tanakae TaxID=230148 RepID=A0A4Z2IFP9_9TELE|nr:hypothetical protein EYF80_012979 [Liparis tanakae]